MKKHINPKVTVVCLSYNQKKYIRQALDGILMQKTTFDFKVLINDDASTDGTKEIIQEYSKKYPEIIETVYHKENQYSKGKRNMIGRFLLPKIKGDYWAICEGDDYWTDPYKLQKQVDFLDQNKEYALCFHPVKVTYSDDAKKDSIFPDINKYKEFSETELLKGNFIQTNSVVYRTQSYENLALDIMPADWYFHLYHARLGKIGFINEVMAVYRRHPSGLWWDSYNDKNKFWKSYGFSHLNAYNELMKLHSDNPEHLAVLRNSASVAFEGLVNADSSKQKILVKDALLRYPKAVIDFIYKQNELILDKNQIIYEKDKSISNLNKKLARLTDELSISKRNFNRVSSELKMVKQSRFWKLRNRVAKLLGKEQV